MLSLLVFAHVVHAQSHLQQNVQLDDSAHVENGVVTAQSKGDRLERFLVVTGLEKIGKTVGDKRQLKVAVADQDRVDVEVDGILLDSG